ncbi:hypothetical protein GCM10011362_19090 [Marinobacter halophilus]|nr:hypothetical protein GCM10011362_19090 [Marinobacter halophilus]
MQLRQKIKGGASAHNIQQQITDVDGARHIDLGCHPGWFSGCGHQSDKMSSLGPDFQQPLGLKSLKGMLNRRL